MENSLTFHPERIPWIGGLILSGAFILAIPFLWLLYHSDCPSVALEKKSSAKKVAQSLSFSLKLKENIPFLPLPDLKNEISFSYDPPRPDGTLPSQQLLVRLKKSMESHRVILPCRLDLQYLEEKLSFSQRESLFWIELASAAGGQIEGRIFVHSASEGKVETGNFLVTPQESPIQMAQEFADGSPFRLLAESRWYGRDLFREYYEGGCSLERLEIGAISSAELLELKGGDVLVWKDGHWIANSSFQDGQNKPIARIESNSGKNLILEGWDSNGHVRISLTPASGPAFKIRGEDLLTSIRVRSEKQISCMLEKQCLILKAGDWVLKTNGRWKVLRKKEEREALLKGMMMGEIFVFEQIHQKQGQKFIQGRLFNPGRFQFVAIEVPAQSMRKPLSAGEKNLRKGKTR